MQISILDKTNQQRINKDIEELNNVINQLNVIDTSTVICHRDCKLTSIKCSIQIAKYTLFLHAHETLTKRDQIVGHETNLDTFQRTEF